MKAPLVESKAGSMSYSVRIARLVLRVYQLTISPLIHAICGPSCGCRFVPTCSCYAGEALQKHGFCSGSWLALRRLLRCHPWHPGGYDPVPGLKSEKKQAIAHDFKTHLDG